MYIQPGYLHCVGFVRYKPKASLKRAGIEFETIGTAFLVYEELNDALTAPYIVTARHVIDDVRQKSADGIARIRLNRDRGSPDDVNTLCKEWYVDPIDKNSEVAVRPFDDYPKWMAQVFINARTFALGEIKRNAKIEPGEEVFITGLFSRYPGTSRLISIVRVGNIAAVAEPQEIVEYANGRRAPAHLIEVRSIGGLSGSPVFAPHWNPAEGSDGVTRRTSSSSSTVNLSFDAPAISDNNFYNSHYGRDSLTKGYCLMGLVAGHWDEQQISGTGRGARTEQINMGIATVVPIEKIREVLDHPDLIESRRKKLANYNKQNAATLDNCPPSNDEPSPSPS